MYSVDTDDILKGPVWARSKITTGDWGKWHVCLLFRLLSITDDKIVSLYRSRPYTNTQLCEKILFIVTNMAMVRTLMYNCQMLGTVNKLFTGCYWKLFTMVDWVEYLFI